MRLLHHYNVVICHILEDEESTAVIWREVVPETAFSHVWSPRVPGLDSFHR